MTTSYKKKHKSFVSSGFFYFLSIFTIQGGAGMDGTLSLDMVPMQGGMGLAWKGGYP
jgi:hypothetical protein